MNNWTAEMVEARLVCAAWTLRRMPDREHGWIYASTVAWPEPKAERQHDYRESISAFEARRQIPPTSAEVDAWESDLALIRLIPDLTDREIVWWAAWHQEGEHRPGGYMPWARVRKSADLNLSRWQLKRRYAASLGLIAKYLTQRQAA